MTREEFEKLKCGDIVRTMVGGVDEPGLEGRVGSILSGPTMDECEIHAHRLHGCDNDPEYLDEWNPEYLEVVDYIHEVTLTDNHIKFIEECMSWAPMLQKENGITKKYVTEITAAFKKWTSRP